MQYDLVGLLFPLTKALDWLLKVYDAYWAHSLLKRLMRFVSLVSHNVVEEARLIKYSVFWASLAECEEFL